MKEVIEKEVKRMRAWQATASKRLAEKCWTAYCKFF